MKIVPEHVTNPADPTAEPQLLNITISALDGLPYLSAQASPMPSGSPTSCTQCHMVPTPCANCAHAYNLSVLAPQNENLTTPQKALLLDHQQLGHINPNHIRALYRCDVTATAPSIVETDCRPCLVPRHPQVFSCTLPMCLACRVAKAKKTPRNHGTTTSVDCSQKNLRFKCYLSKT